MLRLEYTSYVLDFKFQAKTSRGSMTHRKVWYVKIYDGEKKFGIGEAAPIDRLSPEDLDELPEELERLKEEIQKCVAPANEKEVWDLSRKLVSEAFPSIRFALEMGLMDLLNGGEKRIFNHQFQDISIPINGLVWMGDEDFMKSQIKEKLEEGFTCIKLKVGAIDFETELSMIKELRAISKELIIRLDANGAFPVNEVLIKLKKLAAFDIHSIEQPILPMQPEALEIVCKKSEIPVALDEELVWVRNERDRLQLLQEIRPHYLVLKPTLHGGFGAVKNWIDLAGIQGIGWWITSYLESNIGLNAIAQFASNYPLENHQGLGTGSLYTNNIVSPIQIEGGYFKYAKSAIWGDVGL
ncbi:MAG: o-succinylbenzoate synthase [Bacteroidota bacterium]